MATKEIKRTLWNYNKVGAQDVKSSDGFGLLRGNLGLDYPVNEKGQFGGAMGTAFIRYEVTFTDGAVVTITSPDLSTLSKTGVTLTEVFYDKQNQTKNYKVANTSSVGILFVVVVFDAFGGTGKDFTPAVVADIYQVFDNKAMTLIPDAAGTTVASVNASLNALFAALKASGFMKTA